MWESLLRLDGNILLFIQDMIRNPFLDPIMKIITSLGNAGILWIIATILLLIPKRTRKVGVISACALLASTGHSIQEISNSVGFEDPFYFSRAFKDVKGVSPRQYANQARSGREAAMGEDEVKSPSMI